jgi:amidase
MLSQLYLCGMAHLLNRSVRIPAAFCGLVGLKATWGTVPYSGILGLHADIDHCGPLTKTVRDNALMLQAIAGPDGMDDRQPTLMSLEALKYSKHLDAFLTETATLAEPLKGLRIGVLKEGFATPQLNTNIEKAVRSAIADLATLGAEIIEISIPEHDKILTPWTSIQAIAGARDGLLGDQTGRKALHMTDRSRPYQSPLSQDAFNALGAGGKNLYLKYLYVVEKHSTLIQGKATNVIRKQTRAYDAALAGLNAIVMPTILFPASRIFSEGESAGPLERLLRVAGTIANTAPFNATGHPALALPVGFVPAPDDEKVKLPASLQIVGKAFDELACFKIAAAWERKRDWRELNF